MLTATTLSVRSGLDVNRITKAIAKLPTFSGQKVYRGIEINEDELTGFLSQYGVNAEHTFGDFTSCGGSLAASFSERPNVNVIFEITHTTGKDITALADGVLFQGNAAPEIVIKAGSKFKVIDTPVFDPQLRKYIIRLLQTN